MIRDRRRKSEQPTTEQRVKMIAAYDALPTLPSGRKRGVGELARRFGVSPDFVCRLAKERNV